MTATSPDLVPWTNAEFKEGHREQAMISQELASAWGRLLITALECDTPAHVLDHFRGNWQYCNARARRHLWSYLSC